MNCLSALALLTTFAWPGSARTLDKQLATHCGALLLSGAEDRSASREDFLSGVRAYIARLDTPAAEAMDAVEDVQSLALEGWNETEHRARSVRRLQHLVRDLERWTETTSVMFTSRGSDDIARFLERLHGRTSRLDRETLHLAARRHFEPGALLMASAAALFVAGSQASAWFEPPLASALAQSAGIVAAAYVARRPVLGLYDLLVPRGLLDVGRVKIDSHLRVVAEHGLAHAHIGLGTDVSDELLTELRRARTADDLEPARLACLLLTSARSAPGGRMLVDHVAFTDDGERVLLSAVRVVKNKVSAGARHRDRSLRGETLALAPN